MHKLYEFICDELKTIEKKADNGLSMSDIQLMDTLLHAKKNLLKAEEMESESEEYSGAMYPDGRGSYRYENGGSYARGRGRSARRDAMGRYSSQGYSRAADDALESLREMERTATDEQTRQDVRRLITRMEQM